MDRAQERDLVFYIPKNVQTRFVFLPGLGWRELIRMVPFMAGGLLFLVLAEVPVVPRVLIPCLLVAFGWFLLCVPAFDDTTAWDFVQRLRAFHRRQRLFLYRKG